LTFQISVHRTNLPIWSSTSTMQANAETLSALSAALTATVSSDATTRRSAEEQLRQGEKQPGFLLVVLDLVRSSEVDKVVRQSGGVYFKNAIKRLWAGEEVRVSFLHRLKPSIADG
jgi:hypothetical protein